MSGNDERLLQIEFPSCPYCGDDRVCWEGFGHVPGVKIYFTPHYFLETVHTPPDMKRVGFASTAGNERWATDEEIQRVKYIKCMDCGRVLKPEENEEDGKIFDLIIRIGREEVVGK